MFSGENLYNQFKCVKNSYLSCFLLQVKEKCVGSDELSDPLSAVPLTDVSQKETYRNLACAECNDAHLGALKTFQIKVKCHGVTGVSEEEILSDLTYNRERLLWGVNR